MFKERKLLLTFTLVFSVFFSINTMAQSSCCSSSKETASKTAASCSSPSAKQATSGCTPSACRGAKTKFGEAKVISNLRASLIALKADMEKSIDPAFEARSYDIHGIVGETDDESLAIIAKEVQLIETAFVDKLNHKSTNFSLPDGKAKQVQYLNVRINELQKLL